MSTEEIDALRRKIAAECKAKEGSTDADVQTFMGHAIPITKSAKCFSACVLETAGLVCRAE